MSKVLEGTVASQKASSHRPAVTVAGARAHAGVVDVGEVRARYRQRDRDDGEESEGDRRLGTELTHREPNHRSPFASTSIAA
ncbi:MAG TPA: hypothetical protein VND89_11630 [Acidimicrobiales bacterium]|nr:hypothetical protein [Acidimicrobiales bacterium]